ncbi:hypothetical protein GCM10010517_07970 [Streptosporangium fragile]|uniref:Adhesin domain-containing protein n=1 Tax=Streptosporangium fragile TaxID=46186 RepID=A0ABP6I6U3_9ACTN
MPIRSKARIAWIVVGGALTALAVIVTSVAVWIEATAVGETVETTLSSRALTSPKIVVDATGSVNVSVVPGQTGWLDLERSVSWIGLRPSVTEEWDGQTLRLGIRCPRVEPPDHPPACRADYTLGLPVTTDVEVTTHSGTVGVNGIRGDLRLTTTTGDVMVRDTPGTLWVRSEEGSVDGVALRSAKADVETGTGHAILEFSGPPTDVRTVVRTAGDVEVRVPEADGYDIRVDAAQTITKVRWNPEAPRRITALTREGELRILPS